MAKRALVISGGGSKGAFAVGVIKNLALNFPQISFDVFVGTSTGALITPFAALGQLDILEQVYTTTNTENIITKGNIVTRLLGDSSLFDAKPLANLIKKYYDDARCQQVLQLQKELYLSTVCLQTGQAVYFTPKNNLLQTNYEIGILNTADELRRAILASACQPVLMPPIEIRKGSLPFRQYVDGGVREYAGVQLAIDAGAEEIFTILLSPEKFPAEEKVFNDTFTILTSTIDIFTNDVDINDIQGPLLYNKGLKYIDDVKQKMKLAGIAQADIDNYFNIGIDNPFAGKKPLKLYIIRPDAPLGGGAGGLEFNPIEMKGMLAKGKKAIDEFMASLPLSARPHV